VRTSRATACKGPYQFVVGRGRNQPGKIACAKCHQDRQKCSFTLEQGEAATRGRGGNRSEEATKMEESKERLRQKRKKKTLEVPQETRSEVSTPRHSCERIDAVVVPKATHVVRKKLLRHLSQKSLEEQVETEETLEDAQREFAEAGRHEAEARIHRARGEAIVKRCQHWQRSR
jgi:hypothetical protein